jgi:hypothetical protein
MGVGLSLPDPAFLPLEQFLALMTSFLVYPPTRLMFAFQNQNKRKF